MNNKTIKLELTEDQFRKLFSSVISSMIENPTDVQFKILGQIFYEMDKKLENDKQ